MLGRAFSASVALAISYKIVEIFAEPIDQALDSYSPVKLIVGTVAAVLTVQQAYSIYRNWDTSRIREQLFDEVSKAALIIPPIKRKIQKDVSKELEGIKAGVDKARLPWTPVESLPSIGWSH